MSNNQNTPNPKKGENTTPKSEATPATPAETKKPLGNLKPTPLIPVLPTPEEKAKSERLRLEIQVEDNLNEIQQLTLLSKQYIKIDNTLESLKEFEFGADEETYGANLTITDSKRRDFTTKNPRLIEALIEALKVILEEKKGELTLQISKVKIAL